MVDQPGGAFGDPPPRRSKPSRASQNVARVLADPDKVDKIGGMMDELRQKFAGLLFLDHQSFRTRAQRAAARQVFEGYCEKKLGKTDLTDADIWNVETITERTCDLFFCMAEYATSTFGGKPEAGVLQQQKYGMYWWIIRFIPGFSTIYQTWDSMTTAAINRAALDTNFTSEFLPKNKLTDAELELFWQEIPKFPSDRETWLQNYIAWLMVYTTASRPGSFTVTRGYGKNDVLPNGTFRTEAETMRWSDITFTRHQNVAGLAVRVTFRYLKAHKTPEFGNPVDARRTFTLMPLISDHYEFDLGLLLVALAYSRGLFPNYPNVASLFQGTRRLVEKDPKVDGQAVFVASNEAGTLEADVPMHTLSLNLQLRKLCDAVALLGRNTMHCFRRAAITKMRRDEGTETPTNLAARDAADTRTIYAYDDKSLGNYDIVNKAMDVSSMDRNTIREMFSQVNTARIQLPEDLTSRIPGLQDKLNAEADARAKNDDENVEQDRDNDDEAAADMTRAEPSQWDQLPDEVILQPGQTVEEGGATHKGRVQLVERFVALQSEQTFGLPCTLCKLDPTVSYAQKKQTWTLENLDEHLKSSYHTREQQIERAAFIDGGPGATSETVVGCPICQDQIEVGDMIEHVREEHEEDVDM